MVGYGSIEDENSLIEEDIKNLDRDISKSIRARISYKLYGVIIMNSCLLIF